MLSKRQRTASDFVPASYYALPEQHGGRLIADVLTLQLPRERPELPVNEEGGVAVAERPPQVRWKLSASSSASTRRRTLAIRHVSNHRIVALIEIVSPANKDRASHVLDFVNKVDSALALGIHVLCIDQFSPGAWDPGGMHAAIWERFDAEPYRVPASEPLSTVSYVATPEPEAYVEHLKIGDAVTDMPLFLAADRYINVPLEATYTTAYRGLPTFWREVVEGKRRL